MKNRILKISILLFVALSLTGCTTLLKDSNKKPVKHPVTGQTLTKNILCKPEESKTLELYKINKIDMKKLPACETFNITSGGYEGFWETVFVKPLAWLIVFLGKFLRNYGFAIMATTLLIRILTMKLTKKAALQSENMKLAQPDLTKLEKKYKNKKDQESSMMKNQEMLTIYKKYNINPMSGCLFSIIQIPLFFAFYEALNRLPVIFEENFLGFQLGTNPMTAMSTGQFQYLIVFILVIGASYLSFKLNSGASMSTDQAKQMKMMSNMMVIFIGIASLSLSTGIAVYWITNNGFTIIQNLIVKRRKNNVKPA